MDPYGRIEALLQEHNIRPAQLARQIGASSALLSQWKARRQMPSMEKLSQIADYFGVSADYLTGKTDQRYPILAQTHSDPDKCVVVVGIFGSKPETYEIRREHAPLLKFLLSVIDGYQPQDARR